MKKVFTILLISAGIMSAKANITGTDPTVATISENMVITLPVDQPMAEKYIVDVQALNFTTEEALQMFCTNFSDRNMIMTGNFAEKKISIEIKPLRDSTGATWDVARWNQHLTERAPKMQAMVGAMNK